VAGDIEDGGSRGLLSLFIESCLKQLPSYFKVEEDASDKRHTMIKLKQE
jgi:hypothetical protein